MNTKKALNHKY